MAKITVNGVAYDSVESMPADVRRVHDQAVARLPELADRDGDGISDIAQGDGLSVRTGTTLRRKFIVNGTTYDDANAMPPDVHQAFEQAMRAASAGEPKVTKDEVRISFQLTGPGFSLRTGSAAPSASQSVVGTPTPRPIEPDASEGGIRIALTLGACAVGGLVLWLLTRVR